MPRLYGATREELVSYLWQTIKGSAYDIGMNHTSRLFGYYSQAVCKFPTIVRSMTREQIIDFIQDYESQPGDCTIPVHIKRKIFFFSQENHRRPPLRLRLAIWFYDIYWFLCKAGWLLAMLLALVGLLWWLGREAVQEEITSKLRDEMYDAMYNLEMDIASGKEAVRQLEQRLDYAKQLQAVAQERPDLVQLVQGIARNLTLVQGAILEQRGAIGQNLSALEDRLEDKIQRLDTFIHTEIAKQEDFLMRETEGLNRSVVSRIQAVGERQLYVSFVTGVVTFAATVFFHYVYLPLLKDALDAFRKNCVMPAATYAWGFCKTMPITTGMGCLVLLVNAGTIWAMLPVVCEYLLENFDLVQYVSVIGFCASCLVGMCCMGGPEAPEKDDREKPEAPEEDEAVAGPGGD